MTVVTLYNEGTSGFRKRKGKRWQRGEARRRAFRVQLAALVEDEQLVELLAPFELLLALVHVAHVVLEPKQTRHFRLVHLRATTCTVYIYCTIYILLVCTEYCMYSIYAVLYCTEHVRVHHHQHQHESTAFTKTNCTSLSCKPDSYVLFCPNVSCCHRR